MSILECDLLTQRWPLNTSFSQKPPKRPSTVSN